MSDIDSETDTISDELKQSDASKLRTCTGLLRSYHGVAYQIQWLMVIAIEAKNHGKVERFRFRTEVDYKDSGKFDDVTWEYYCVNEEKIKYNFLQAKHKLQEENERISIKDLENVNSPFGLEKYYVSFIKSIQNNDKYTNGLVENLIIATNIDLDDNLKQIFKNTVTNIPPLNAFESEGCRRPKCWKIDPNANKNLARIIAILEETHDLIKLAKMLDDLIFNDKVFTVSKELREYSISIFEKLLNIDCTKISCDFIENKNLSLDTTFLREAFLYVAFVKKKQLSTDDVAHGMRETTEYNIEDFANFFATKINEAQYNNKLVKIRISKNSKSYENHKHNINKLANFVLIKKNGIKFNPKFWTQNENESCNYCKSLKINLKRKLIELCVISVDDTNKEISVKMDPYRFQITNFSTCMIHLTDESTFWDVVKDYNTRLSIIPNQSDILTKALPEYSLRTVKDDINIFFSILVFAVNFTKTILNEAVEDNFNKSFLWIDNEFTAYAFRSEIANALDLTQEKYISNTEEVTQFFDKVEDQINRLVLIGPTLEYCTKIDLYDIEFKPDVINEPSMNEFIIKDIQKLREENCKDVFEHDNIYNKQVLCYTSNNILLSSIKVYHLLKSIKYDSQRNYIFMRLESIIYLHEYIMRVFQKSVSLLIIECDLNSKFDLRKICKKLISILHSDPTKKILLITQGNHYLLNQLKREFKSSFCEIVDSEVNFCNLQKKTQQKLLENYKVLFQGKEIFLGDLIRESEYILIDSEMLCQFLNNNEIEVCNQNFNCDHIFDFYISREIICRKKVSNTVLKEDSEDLYAVSNIQIKDFINIAMQYHKSNWNIASKISEFRKIDFDYPSTSKFTILDDDGQYIFLRQASKQSNIHWLVNENNCFKWNGTKGSLYNLRPYLRPRKNFSEVDNEIIHELKNDRIVVIAADPGMGKSTLIKHLALKLKDEFPLLWVLVIDLGKFRSELKKIKINDEESVIGFIITIVNFKTFNQIKDEHNCRKIINWFNKQTDTKDFIDQTKVKGLDLLEMIVFYNKLHKSGEVYIFLDGFDEVCPKYEAEVTYLIKILKNNSLAHIWTTCRTYNIINTLEDNLEVVSYGIKSFSEIDQEMFLLKYWKFKLNVDILDENRAKTFIVTLLLEFSKATNDNKRTFVGIPLQIKMLAQNRLLMFKEFYESGVLTLNDEDKMKIKKGLNLVNLYDEFIDIKFHEIRFKEKKHIWPLDDEDIEKMIEQNRQNFIYEHQVLSIYTLYAERRELCSESIHSIALSLLPKIRKADDKNAIICGVVDESPVFVHQTYAEYFASLFLWNNFQSVTLEEFSANFLHNMLNGTFFSDERLQVCKFFYFMADKYFNDNIQCIYKGHEDIKVACILQELTNIVYVIYESYENQGIFSKGIDDIAIIIDDTAVAKSMDNIFNKNRHFAQVVRYMLYIVESYLINNKPDHVINTILEKCNTIHLLQMASEIGCSNLVKIFLSIKVNYNFKQCLKNSKWYFSPVWLSARNGHLDILKQLSMTIDQEWPDKDDRTLAQRAYNLPECDVLKSCLLLNIIDANPYSDLNNKQTLPIVNALQNVWPLKLIEMLIEKTDIDIFNKFVCNHSQLKASFAVCTSLLKYEMSIVHMMIDKGMNFFGTLNILFFEFTFTSLYDPINSIKYAKHYSPSFHSEQEFFSAYDLIEVFLKSGVGYNSLDDVHSTTTSEYSKQVYYMHQLFKHFADYKVSNVHGVYLLLTLILNAVNDEFEIIKWSDSSLLLKVKRFKYSSTKRKRTYTNQKHCDKPWPKSYENIIIELIPVTENNILDTTKEYLEIYLTNVSKFMEKCSKEINEFRKYPDSKLYNNILIAYEEMLKYHCSCVEPKKIFHSLSRFEKYIFRCVLNLYIRQDYNVSKAFDEVSRNLCRYKMINKWLQEKPQGYNISFKELIQIFGLELGEITNKNITIQYEITQIIINIFNNGALKLLLNVWNELNYVGENNFQKVIKSMSKYENVSTKMFDLFNKLDTYYAWVIEAIKSRKSQNLLKILGNIDNALVKSVVNAQDSKHGSPLHCAVFIGNVEMVKILLLHNADPNQDFQFDSNLVMDSEECASETPQDIAHEREHLNPEMCDNQDIQFDRNILINIEECTRKTPQDIAQERKHMNIEVYGTIIEVLNEFKNRFEH